MKLKFILRYLPALFIVAFSSMVFGQVTLVGYNFNNQNLDHYTLHPSVVQTPPTTLAFNNTGSSIGTYNENGNGTGNYRIQTDDSESYLELRINTTGQSNMSMKFDANVAPLDYGVITNARWRVKSDRGTNGANWYDVDTSPTMSAMWTPQILLIPEIYLEGDATNISIPIPSTSEVPGEVRFRLYPEGDGWLGIGEFAFRIDNLRIEKGIPNISVFANGNTNTPLPHNVPASVTNNTDFGSAVTVGNSSESGFFRIRNIVSNTTGAPTLNISSVTITGINASDFQIFDASPFPSTVLPTTNSGTTSNGYYRQFKVRFTPTGDGLRTAQVHIRSNGNQDPYIINLVAQGASCSLFTTPYVVNEFNPVLTQSLPSDITVSDIITGTAQTNNVVRVYPNGAISLPTYNAPAGNNTSAWFTRNAPKTVEFGGTNGIDIAGQKDVSIAFNVGGYSTENSNTSGPNADSYIILEIDHNGTPKEVIRLRGANGGTFFNNKYNIANPLSGNNYSENTFDPTAPRIEVQNNGGLFQTTRTYQTIRINIPQSIILTNPNLKFRIKAYTGSDSRVWIIDNVRIEVSNSEFTQRTIAGGWTDGAPNANKKIIIPAGTTYQIPNAGLEVCECEVKNGGTLNLGAESTPTFLKVKGKITVENGGTFEVRTNSNLVQVEDDAVNTGNIKVNRQVNGIHNVLPNNMAYIYWSSPVSGQQLKAFSPGTPDNRFYRYEESNDYFYPVNHLSNFEFGKGYAIRAEGSPLPNPYNKLYSFTGVPHNGNQYDQANLKFIKSANGNGYNLIGNPYPSNIHADDFIVANPGIYPTIFFWQNNVYIETQQGSGYYGSNYAVYNMHTGGVPGTYDDNSTIVEDGTIKSTQGFIVQVKEEGDGDEIIFRNNMRRTADSGTFHQKVVQKDRFWITLTNYDNLVNTMLVGYIPGATDGFEQDYDVEILSEGSDAIYTVFDDKKLIIQGLEHPMTIHDVIPVGVKHFSDSKYIIALQQKEGVFNGQKIYLKDKYLNIIHNLTQGYYEYEGLEGTFNDRFEIVFKKASFTETAIENPINKIDIDKIDHHILISSSIDNIIDVEVFNLSGWSIYKKSDVNTKEFKIPFSTFAKQIIVVNVKTETGEIVSKKFILN